MGEKERTSHLCPAKNCTNHVRANQDNAKTTEVAERRRGDEIGRS
jgi:hypothetical protein